tara:strand:+ start:180 stop:338 length:159 start_codon:yes stop_codon:yes gene_type:complete
MGEVIKAIDKVIEKQTNKYSNELEKALDSLLELESKLGLIIDDIKEVIEGRI